MSSDKHVSTTDFYKQPLPEEEEGSLLDDMNDFFDNAGQQQDLQSGVEIIRPTKAVDHTQSNLDRFYQKLEELGMNLDELKPVLECQDNQLILSGAGSGKTTGLILKIIRDLISGDMMKVTSVNSVYGVTQVQVPANILISTFLKTGAQELQTSFREWCLKLNIQGLDYSNIKFRTIHAEVKDALSSMGINTAVLESGDQILRAVLNKYSVRSINSTSRSITVDELNDVAGIVAFARNRLDAERYNQTLMEDYRIDTILLDAILRDLKIHRSATGKMDFEDMQEMLLEALQVNQNVRDVIANRYDFVYVDEFQDTSQLQYELLKYYFAGAKRKVVVGDDDQSIYSWRGGDIDIITNRFKNDYNPTINVLATNYRCKSNILNPVIPSIELNPNRHPKNLKSFAEGGEVNLIINGNVNMLVDSMRKDLSEKKRVGVLARVNADLLIPAMILELDGGVEFGISKAVNMNGRLARQVFGVIDLITKRLTEEFPALLKMFLPRYNWYEADNLYNVLLANKSMNLYNIPIEDLQHSVPNLAPTIKGLRAAKDLGGAEAYLYLLGLMEEVAYTGKSMYADNGRRLVSFVKRMILEHKDLQDKSISELDTLFNQVLPERLARRIKYSTETPVKLTTVHEAKGKEWDSVYIWNNVEGSFPNKVGNRDITPAEMEEERRVHYIAWTRAKSKLTVFTDQTKMGDFLRECDLTNLNSVDEVPQTAEMSKVFKKAQKVEPVAVNTDTFLRSYIADITANGGMSDERFLNYEMVSNQYGFDELVTRLETQYGITLEAENRTELFDLFFSSLADDIFTKGKFQA